MNAAHAPEIRLLLMACAVELSADKTAQLVAFLQQHSLNWDRLYALAGRHRLTPFLYRTLRQLPNIPASFLATLQQDCRLTATDTLLKLHEYQRVAALLTEHAIDHVAFKGVHLAGHGYPESSLRPIGDLDILVGRENLYEAIRILASDGYAVGANYQHYRRYAERVMLDDLHEVSLFKPFFDTGRFDVDLHWEIECLFRKFATFELHDVVSPPEFRVENQIVLLVVHHGVINSWERIGYINDLYFLLNNANINWSWLLAKLNQYRVETVFFVGLHWCQQVWSLELPPLVQPLMPPPHRLRWLADVYEKKWVELHANSFRVNVLNFAITQTGFIRKLKVYAAYAHSFIFRPYLIRLNRYQLYIPKEWGFITVFVRVIQALRKRR